MVAYAFNFSTGEADTGKSLSWRPPLSMVQVSVQPSLGTEKLKVGEDVIKQGSHVPAPTSRRPWKLQLQGSEVKDRKKGLWNLLPKLRKAAEDRHVSGKSQYGGLKRLLHKIVKMKPGLPWRS